MKLLLEILFSLCLCFAGPARGFPMRPEGCDTTPWRAAAGNLRQTARFPWLGVLRTRVVNKDKVQIAATGIVLVKYNYAIVNSDDLNMLSQDQLLKDSKAMFLPADDAPWYVAVLTSVDHPDYYNATISAISLMELQTNEGPHIVLPVCLPKMDFDSSKDWFVVGYTDHRMVLEKILYKAEEVNKTLCDLFYNRGGSTSVHPSHYVCAHAPANREHCDWENGMAIASNTTGVWVLTGFSLRGPGCAGPAVFADVARYAAWIHETTYRTDRD